MGSTRPPGSWVTNVAATTSAGGVSSAAYVGVAGVRTTTAPSRPSSSVVPWAPASMSTTRSLRRPGEQVASCAQSPTAPVSSGLQRASTLGPWPVNGAVRGTAAAASAACRGQMATGAGTLPRSSAGVRSRTSRCGCGTPAWTRTSWPRGGAWQQRPASDPAPSAARWWSTLAVATWSTTTLAAPVGALSAAAWALALTLIAAHLAPAHQHPEGCLHLEARLQPLVW
mmetsp:Transcript_13460/g.42347  ORF Transcript_13460/g.42347 Transcript_13460/m.42347 type:complete len:227 (-) Transcript_13460:453-1133(-)